MTLLLLVRHGTTELTGKRLYGRSPGVHLSVEGRRQAERLAERLRPVRPTALYSSPMERCVETAEPIAAACGLELQQLAALAEIDYGRWTGRSFPALARTRLWRRLHRTPSTVRFPGGEAMAEAQRRIVACLEDLAARHPRGRLGIVSHGDPIDMALAHFAGMHLDLFMRLEVRPGSVSAAVVGDGPPKILRLNDTGTLEDLRPGPRRPRKAAP